MREPPKFIIHHSSFIIFSLVWFLAWKVQSWVDLHGAAAVRGEARDQERGDVRRWR